MFTKPKWWLSISMYFKQVLSNTGRIVRPVLLIAVCGMQKSLGQGADNTWVLSNYPVCKLQFTSDSFAIDTFTPVPPFDFITFVNASATANDDSGNLQFFTNGVTVFDMLGRVMPNGTGLSPSMYTQSWDKKSNIFQSVMCLKKPLTDSIYYIFHYTPDDVCPPPVNGPYFQPCSLLYTVVDMRLNNGLGSVVSKNNIFLEGRNLASGQFSACRHANGKDWWLVKNAYLENKYYKFLFTDTGIAGPFTQSIGNYFREDETIGGAVFSPNGTKFASGTGFSYLSLLDFNRCTGEFSNPTLLFIYSTGYSTLEPTSMAFSSAFSSNNQFLYVNAGTELYQYDLLSADIQGSEFLIYSTISDSIEEMHFLNMQLTASNAILISPYVGDTSLSIISSPDSPGIKCNFLPYHITLPNYLSGNTNGGRGMPNFPNFRLGASPIYQMGDAGPNRTICKDSTTQLGSQQKVNALTYHWRSTDPNAYISDVHHHNPTVSTTADEVLFIVDVVDTVSRLTCTERSDTVVVKTYTCYPNQLNIPTIIKSGSNPYLIIPNLPANTAVQVYNAAGQLMFESNSYQNNWHIGNVAAGIYAIRTRMSNGTEQRGKVVVVD